VGQCAATEIANVRAGSRRTGPQPGAAVPGAAPVTPSWLVSRPVLHDAVVGAAGAGAAGAGAVQAQHLRGGPAVQLNRSPSAPPRSSQVWLKWCRNRCVQASTPHCRPRRAIIW
jgi:hypothetical protein